METKGEIIGGPVNPTNKEDPRFSGGVVGGQTISPVEDTSRINSTQEPKKESEQVCKVCGNITDFGKEVCQNCEKK